MFGGLHIEMAALKILGDLLEGNGWTGALVQAGVATPGTADSLQEASHVTHTRRAYKVTASCLYLLLQKAYSECSNDLEERAHLLPLKDWCSDRAAVHAKTHFYHLAAGTRGDDLHAGSERGRLPTLRGCPDQDRALVLCLGAHPLCQVNISPSACSELL